MNIFRQKLTTGLIAVAAIVVAAACGSSNASTPTASPVSTPTPSSSGPDPLVSSTGYGYGKEPTNVQGIVNRVHAIVIARVTMFDGSRAEGPYVDGVLTEPPTPVGGEPEVSMQSGYFSFTIEEVLMDDGYVANAPVIRGIAEEDHRFNPDVGERYILSLMRNPDNQSYGVWPSFGLIELHDDGATRQDGSAFRFDAPTDEDALVEAFEDAIRVRRVVTLNEWNEPYADLPAAGS